VASGEVTVEDLNRHWWLITASVTPKRLCAKKVSKALPLLCPERVTNGE